MTMPIETDRRYRVTQKAVDEMRELRKNGWSYQSIANKFGVSFHTAYYWVNEDYRAKKMAKNAKRVADDPVLHRKREHDRRRANWNDELFRLNHYVTSARNEARTRRVGTKFRGRWISLKEAERILDENFKKGGQKIA